MFFIDVTFWLTSSLVNIVFVKKIKHMFSNDMRFRIMILFKKSLKIPKGQSETVYRRRIDNKKKYKRTNDRQNIHIKLKIE